MTFANAVRLSGEKEAFAKPLRLFISNVEIVCASESMAHSTCRTFCLFIDCHLLRTIIRISVPSPQQQFIVKVETRSNDNVGGVGSAGTVSHADEFIGKFPILEPAQSHAVCWPRFRTIPPYAHDHGVCRPTRGPILPKATSMIE